MDQLSTFSGARENEQAQRLTDEGAGQPSATTLRGDNDLREALRAMVTVVGIEAGRGEGGSLRAQAAAAIGRLLGINLVATALRMPSAIGRAIPADPLVLQRLVSLLQQPNAGAVSRLAQVIDAGTLTLRPGFSQRLPRLTWSVHAAQSCGRDGARNAPGRDDDRSGT